MLLGKGGNFRDRTFIVDFELSGGTIAGSGLVELNAASFDGEVEVVSSGSGIASRIGLGAGRDVCDAQWEK